jgi:hypothetical protein
MQRLALVLGLSALVLFALPSRAGAGSAKGTLVHPRATLELKYAYLVKGPDALEPGKTIRRLILSAEDLGAKLDACTTMSCTDGEVSEGMTVDLDGGPRLNFWMAIQGQMVQYSGTQETQALVTRVDEPGKLAGTLRLDATGSGGPKVDVDFDAPLVRELTRAR